MQLTKKNWDMCPRFRYAKGHASNISERFRLSLTHAAREELKSESVIHYGFIHNVAQPLAWDVGGTDYAMLWEELKSFHRALIGGNPELSGCNFPPDGNRQIILDRLDEISQQLKEMRGVL